MAKWTVGNGLNDYVAQLNNLLMNTEETIGQAVYVGAGIVADAVRSELNGLPTDEHRAHGYLTEEQKTGLSEGLGISGMRTDNGFIHVKVGMDGYNSVVTKKYPNGQPNAMIARAMESGTSFSKPNPFISRGTKSSQSKAEKAMADKFDELIKKQTE